MFLKRNVVTNLMPEKLQHQLYRKVFSGVEGNKVLTDILIDLCFFDEIENNENVSDKEKMYLNNAAKKILRKCGIISSKNVEEITKALFKMPIR